MILPKAMHGNPLGWCRRPCMTLPVNHGKQQKKLILYSDNPDGLSGHEDVGQMSAWNVMRALGPYPVQPAGGIYVFWKPLFLMKQPLTLAIMQAL
jgi:putative alpha-1,2-mannosidase